MTPAAARWFGVTSRFPSGWASHIVLLVILVGLVALDTTGGDFDLTNAKDWFDLILPWTPLFAFLIGPRIAVVTWFVMFGVVLALGAVPIQVSGTALPTMLLLGLSAYVLPWRAAAVLTGGVLVMLALAVVENPSGLGIPGAVTFGTLAVLAAGAGFGLSLLRSRLERSARREAELREQQARVRAEERTRLAYELHDVVANQVTLIAMQARRAEFADPAKTKQILGRIDDAASRTLQDLRSLVLLLRTEDDEGDPALAAPEVPAAAAAPATGGLADDLEAVGAELEQAGFAVRSQVTGPVESASAGLRQILGRTLRELATNVLKHGDPGGPVELRMAFTEDEVTLAASNRISAATPIFSSGTGLQAMRARCEVFGGHLDTASEGGRWTTSISFPAAKPFDLGPAEDTA